MAPGPPTSGTLPTIGARMRAIAANPDVRRVAAWEAVAVAKGDLPADVDSELWFECRHHPGSRDYLLSTPWHTFPGRMSAWCAERQVSFRVSFSELPPDLSPATQYWVKGFLVGNLPRQPDMDDDDGAALAAWQIKARNFLATGQWPPEDVASSNR